MNAPYVQLRGKRMKRMLAGEFPPALRLAGALKDVDLILTLPMTRAPTWG